MEDQDFEFGGEAGLKVAHDVKLSGSSSELAPAPSVHPDVLPLVQYLSSDPWDATQWNALLDTLGRIDVTSARPHYERMVALFPGSARTWRQYVEHEKEVRLVVCLIA